MLLLASPVLPPLSNPLLLQPVQAQSNLSFRTPIPANGTMTETGDDARLTFDAQGGTFLTRDRLETNGTFQITSRDGGQILYSGSVFRVQGCCLTNPSSGEKISLIADNIEIFTSCSTLANNDISVLSAPNGQDVGDFNGPVECSSKGGDTTQQSSTTATTTQDSDGDGIPDSSDRCTHNSNHRCFKEDTTTQQLRRLLPMGLGTKQKVE